ncbi:MAG: hypothetical protein KTR31_25655 [Myxococcales bacterium]|nr:hypothetical protein [Myxococcales bacterium]
MTWLTTMLLASCGQPPDLEWQTASPTSDGVDRQTHGDTHTVVVEETFVLGPQTTTSMVDVLFVVDDTASAPSRTELTSLVESLRGDVFPTDTRVAVTRDVPFGMMAARSLLEQPDTFRPGAGVALVFVSTVNHLEPRPVHFDELEAAVATGHPVASFTLAAAVPFTPCTAEATLQVGRTAFEPVVHDGRGTVMNLCGAGPAEWRAFLETVGTQSTVVRHPVLPLARPAVTVLSVQRDGTPVPHRLDAHGQVLVLEQMPQTRATIRVRYRPG